jgi:hypothetical protein
MNIAVIILILFLILLLFAMFCKTDDSSGQRQTQQYGGARKT